ncbi:penicillin-binding transpeptidase domain-containing protein, partial [Elusimicrobiota bacterium]
NNGIVFNPYIVKLIISPEGKILKRNEAVLNKRIDINEKIFTLVKEAMKGVSEYGTAQFLNLPFDVASKTGTAESPSGDDHAWFACFEPVDDPQIAIVVLVENGGYGAVAAMPVAREILNFKFHRQYQ